MAQMPMVYSPPSTGWPFTWLQGIVSLEKSPLEQYIYGTSIPSQTLHNWKTINGLVGCVQYLHEKNGEDLAPEFT